MSHKASTKKDLSPKQHGELLAVLKVRFERSLGRHKGLDWAKVQSRICGTGKLWSLAEMERTGGEPDVVGQGKHSGAFIFMDCAPESPLGRFNDYDGRQKLDIVTKQAPHSKSLEFEGFGNYGEFATIRLKSSSRADG